MISENDKNKYLNTLYMDTIQRYGKVNGIFNSKLGIPKFIEDFGLYESANKDESVKLNGEKFLKNNRYIVYTHELLDTMIQENPENAWNHYMAYTKQGGSDTFTNLLKKADLNSPFEENTLKEVCKKVDAFLSNYDLAGVK